MRGRQSVRKGVWYLGGRRRKRIKRGKKGQRGAFFPLAGLLGAATGPIIGEIAKPLLKKFIGGRRRRRWGKTYC